MINTIKNFDEVNISLVIVLRLNLRTNGLIKINIPKFIIVIKDKKHRHESITS